MTSEIDRKLVEKEVDSKIVDEREEDNGGVEFTFKNDEEWLVFSSYDDAEEFAITRVYDDLSNEPEIFNQEWLHNQLDEESAKYFFREFWEEDYSNYIKDIENEGDEEYGTRLKKEMYEADIISEEEATDEDFDVEDKKEEFIEKLADKVIEQDGIGLEEVRFQFGDEFANNLIKENNLIDLEKASKNAIKEDGVAHFLSSYDGKEIELENGNVMYRTN